MARKVKGSQPHPPYALPSWFGTKCPFLHIPYHYPCIKGKEPILNLGKGFVERKPVGGKTSQSSSSCGVQKKKNSHVFWEC